MARLDRLGGVKDVAHLAATLGRVFSYELLAAVSSLDEPALQRALAQLVEAELIYRRGTAPDLDLRVQARPGPGRRLQQPVARQAPAAPQADREDHRGALSRNRREQARAARASLPRGGAAGQGVRLCDAGGRCRGRPLRRDRGARQFPGGARPRALAAALGEHLARPDRGGPEAGERRPEPDPLRAGPRATSSRP